MCPEKTFIRANGERLTGVLVRENNKTVVLLVPKGKDGEKYIKVRKTKLV